MAASYRDPTERLSESMSRAAQSASQTASGLAKAAGHKMDRALDSAETMARSAADQGRELASNIDRTVREQPLVVLAVVAALGLVVGALWKADRRHG